MTSATTDAVPATGLAHSKQRHRRRSTARGVPLLMYAAQQGDVDRVRNIIKEQSESLQSRDRTGKTPLHYCCTSDSIRAAQAADLLVMAAPDLVESRDEDGFTPLHLAVIAGNMSLVTFLLANNADVNSVDNEKHTVVHWATVCGETAALGAVLAAGAPVSTPDVHGGYPLHYAAQMCGGDKDSNLGLQVLQTLLTHNDIVVSVEDGDGRQPLLWGASAGSAKAVLALIRAGAKVESSDKDGLTALHCAASRGHTDCIDSLLTLCGASPDVIDSNGCTALHYAVTLGHADATALLLAHGADPNRQDRKGRTPAHCGCAKGQFETVKMIGAHGANLWLRNARGDLPLHEAAASGRRDLVRWLLDMRPSQVNARNNDGRCPLHLAALNDNADMCKILLDAGAQVNPILRTSRNTFMTPLDCSLQRGFRSTAKYLQLHGGIPANRVGDIRQGQVNLPIKEDASFRGGTSSDSERENGEGKKHTKRIQKRKTLHKLDKKKASFSESDRENNKLTDSKSKRRIGEKKQRPITGGKSDNGSIDLSSRKPSPAKIDFTNEIVVTGKTDINIHQTKQINIDINELKNNEGNEGTKTSTGADERQVEKDVRPKSAKHSKIKEKSTKPTVKENSAKKAKIGKQNAIQTQGNINQATHVEPVEQSLQKTVQEIAEDDNHLVADSIKNKKLSDEQSNTSEDVEEHKSVLVEAAIHEPPKDSEEVEAKIKYDDEINQTKMPIAVNENQPHTDQIIEQDVKEDSAVVADEEVKLNGKDEVAEEGKSEKSDTNVEVTEAKVSTNKNGSGDGVEITENVAQDIIDNECASTTIADMKRDTDTGSIEETSKPADNSEPKSSDQEIEIMADAAIVKPNESEIIKHTAKDEENAVEGEVTSMLESKKVSSEQEDQTGEKEDQETSETTSSTVIQITKDDQVNDAKEEATKQAQETKIQSKSKRKKKIVTNTDNQAYEIIYKTLGEQESDDTVLDQAEIKKQHRRKEQLKPQKTISESKSSDEYSSDMESESSTSASTTVKEHKSFRILNDKEAKEIDSKRMKPKKMSRKVKSPPKKQRSRSEENKKVADKKRKSKIPTPLTKTPLSKSDRYLNIPDRKSKSSMESRVPSLPNINKDHPRSESNLSAPLFASAFSENEKASASDVEEDQRGSAVRRRKIKRKSKPRDARSAGSDYESSNVIDSGFEPSPRSSRIPKWKNMSDRGVNMNSVTQSIQSNIRRYHLERKIFQHLLDLKRMQIRAGQHNEAILVKRAVDAYHQSCASTVGAGRYVPEDFTFKSFEKFLYLSLRKLQRNGADYLKGLPENITNPLLCTQSTHRCMHATHAYTGIPCAAYLPKMDHHTIPKIGFTSTQCKPGTGFLPTINPKKAVTLELCHGNDKQVISLPADRLDQNKRYYVTFTVKGSEHSPPTEENTGHRHSKSD